MKKGKLHTIKKSGFKAPKDYFNNLEENILSQAKLHNAVSTSGFNTPKDYLNSLEDIIIHKLSSKKEIKIISIFSKRNLIYATGIAAAIVFLFNISLFKSSYSFEDLKNETVETYLLEEDLTYSEFASLLSQEELANTTLEEYTFTDDNIEDYLLNTITIEDLIIE